MKSLLKKIISNDFVFSLRNTLKFRPVDTSLNSLKKSSSISDAFCWRTDNGYKTLFIFSDLLKLFYDLDDSYVELLIYTKDKKLIKTIKLNSLNFSNKILIDKKLLNDIEDYGTFYFFHRLKNKTKEEILISNRCYLGFYKDDNLPSFVHGNVNVVYKEFVENEVKRNIIKSSILKNQIYEIQNLFEKNEKNELFFINPLSKKIKLSLNNNFYTIDSGCSKIIDIKNQTHVKIVSNCSFLRPIIFNYNKNYIDVYHS